MRSRINEMKFKKIWNRLLHVKVHRKSWQNGSDPFISEKNVRIIGFMVFKSPGSDSRPARTHFGRYLRTTGIFFKPDFCIEIVSLSRSICKTMIPLLWTFFSFFSVYLMHQSFSSRLCQKVLISSWANHLVKILFFWPTQLRASEEVEKGKEKSWMMDCVQAVGENQVWFVL